MLPRSRDTGWILASLLLAGALWATPSFAQAGGAAQGVGTAGTPASLQVHLGGTVHSAIQLTVVGGNDTNVTGSGTSGTVNFGDITATNLLTGVKYRDYLFPPRGTYLVATLEVQLKLSGGLSNDATVTVNRTSVTGPLEIPDGNLYVTKSIVTVLAYYLFPPNDLPNSFIPLHTTPETLTDSLGSGDTFDHQVVIWIPDSQAPGNFASTVTYSATMN